MTNPEFLYRLFEILPGALTWGIFLLLIILSFIFPLVVAGFIIVYAIFWFVRSITMSYRLIIGYRNFARDIKINWFKKCQNSIHENEFKKIFHAIIMATYKEELPILETSLKAIIGSNYPMEKVIFVLATEERDKKKAQENAAKLQKKFGRYFYKFLVTLHPADLPNEVRGKGANITFAAKILKKIIDKKRIPYENIIVTTLDADNRVHKQYLAYLTNKFLHDNDPIHKSFQPIPMFLNNIWEVPLPLRAVALGSSFWQLIESTRPFRLRNFSAHAQSFAALVKINFWSKTTIVEDGHQYWRSYFAFNGRHTVVPLYIPIFQDAVLSSKGTLMTYREQYLQKRRWAWGCSDIPYVLANVIQNKRLPVLDKWLQTFRLIEGHFSWATTSIILAFLGWLPRINPDFTTSVLAYNFPLVYSRILTASMVGLVVTLTISNLVLSTGNKKILRRSIIWEWIVSPLLLTITNVAFGALPAIDAQTRLMFGKYLEYRVTEKAIPRNHVS